MAGSCSRAALTNPTIPTITRLVSGNDWIWANPFLVGRVAEREVHSLTWFEVPALAADAGTKSPVPGRLEILGDGPAQAGAAAADANQVAPVAAVVEGVAAVKDGQIVDEMHVARLRLDAQLDAVRNLLDHVQRRQLLLRRLGQPLVPRVRLAAQERGAPKVDNELAVLHEEGWACLEARDGKGERRGQRHDEVRTRRCHEVVDGIARRDDAAAALGGLPAGQPADDVTVLLVVECLVLDVSGMPDGRGRRQKEKREAHTMDLLEWRLWFLAVSLDRFSTMWTVFSIKRAG